VLNLGSGSCRDVFEALKKTGTFGKRVALHCVDLSQEAISFAQELVDDLDAVDFRWEVGNVLRFRPVSEYDLVWASGLFDYLNDRLAVALLKRIWSATRDGGTIVFGNIHPSNPTRLSMEWCGGWMLHHRTRDDLRLLCEMAGISRGSFSQEPEGVFHFCCVEKS